MIADCFVSVVAPLNNDAALIPGFVDETLDVLRTRYANYELVLVDDGSTDDTPAVIRRLLGQFECVRYVRLSRHFGQEVAMLAGLDAVIGDFIVVMLPNHDPPGLIPELVQRVRDGHGVVFGIRRRRVGDTMAIRAAASIWYAYARRFLNHNLPRNASQFCALSRQALNAVVRIRDKYRYLRILTADIGYAHLGVPYDPIVRNVARGGRSFWSRAGVAMDLIVANSQHPLRAVTILGVGASVLNLAHLVFLVSGVALDRRATGTTALPLQLSAMFLLLFLMLAVMSEYVGHILVESRDRPLYHVLEERDSELAIADRTRRNVVTESVIASSAGPTY